MLGASLLPDTLLRVASPCKVIELGPLWPRKRVVLDCRPPRSKLVELGGVSEREDQLRRLAHFAPRRGLCRVEVLPSDVHLMHWALLQALALLAHDPRFAPAPLLKLGRRLGGVGNHGDSGLVRGRAWTE